MTITRKLLAMLLCVALVASLAMFAGCDKAGTPDGGNDAVTTTTVTTPTTTAPPPPTDEELIVGTWKGTFDITEAINKMYADTDSESDIIKFEKLAFDMIMTFNADGTYVAKGDEESVKSFVESFKAGMRNFFVKMYEELATSMEYESMDAMFADMGTSAEEAIDQALAEGFSEETVKEMTASFEAEGTYALEDGKLFTAAKGEEINKEQYETYEITTDTLKLLSVVSDSTVTDENGDVIDLGTSLIDPTTIYPITLTRVK